MPLLSVIIPAYNVEPFVQACLDSVFALPLSADEMEVIIIDDGSTDGTPSILSRCAAAHPNMRVLRQANQGQSVARNWGIEEARGQYIYFVDADDAVTEPCPLPWQDMRDGLYDIIGVETLFEDAQGQRRRYCRQTFPYDEPFEQSRDYLSHHNVLGIVYGYVFRTSFLQQTQALRFTPGIYHQDEEFIVKAFCLGGRFVFRRGYTYIYYQRIGSSIHTATRQRHERLMNDCMVVLRHLTAWQTSDMTHAQWQPILQYKLAWMAIDVLRLLIRQGHDIGYAMGIVQELRRLHLYPITYYPEVRFLVFRALTCTPWLVRFWIRHRRLLLRWV